MTTYTRMQDVEIASAAYANRRAWHSPKRAASAEGRHERSGRRWFDVYAAKGSPAHKVARHVIAADDPWQLIAYGRSMALKKEIIDARVTRDKLKDRIREHERKVIELQAQEGASWIDTVSGLSRSDLNLRIAGEREHLGALWEAAEWQEPPITVDEVFGRVS